MGLLKAQRMLFGGGFFRPTNGIALHRLCPAAVTFVWQAYLEPHLPHQAWARDPPASIIPPAILLRDFFHLLIVSTSIALRLLESKTLHTTCHLSQA